MMNEILHGDCIDMMKTIPNESINTCITSPPYFGLRDYGEDNQIGLEETPDEYVEKLVNVFREVKRILRDDGTLWLNLGDSYAGSGMGAANYPELSSEKQSSNHGSTTAKGRGGMTYGLKPKDLIGIPWRVAFALQSDGWYLRQDIIWHKPNPMPESVTDRCTKSHEYIFLLSKNRKYYFDNDAIKEEASPDDYIRDQSNTKLNNTPGRSKMKGLVKNDYETRNKRDVWTVNTKPYKEAHFAVYPTELITPCVLAGCPENGVVFDPFMGSGTTAYVAKKLNRKYLGTELNQEYIDIAERRLKTIEFSLFAE